ncbi:MAG: hydrogenase expression/formation protein HypE [Candidatus Latescibacterota bacterium]|nr:MAG: hydrogenase expression/formation protein HypE [Candidatus Latescibacterota bacterium]
MTDPEFALSCPIPIRDYPRVLLAHGGGGRLMGDLIEKMFLGVFGDPELRRRHDSAVFAVPEGRLAFTTDSYVVSPLFFPGGDIGSLAVHGTVNDLAMSGARPLCLTAGFILEEGLPMETLWRVVRSMGEAARASEVRIVSGDTKVVERGKGDGVFLNTAGIGIVEAGGLVGPESIRAGDAILLSGDIGRHGMAILAVREGLEFETTIESDSAPVVAPVLALLGAGIEAHCLRDLTRGGLASALNELAVSSTLSFSIDEGCVPIREDVRAACEILGLDPFYVANEGRFVAFVPEKDADRALAILRSHPVAGDARRIGAVLAGPAGLVTLRSSIGAARVLDLLSGEQLPRIC